MATDFAPLSLADPCLKGGLETGEVIWGLASVPGLHSHPRLPFLPIEFICAQSRILLCTVCVCKCAHVHGWEGGFCGRLPIHFLFFYQRRPHFPDLRYIQKVSN